MAPTTPRPKTQGSGQSKTNILDLAVSFVKALLLNRQHFWHLTTCLLLGELALGALIIWKVPYTKIDWPAYMQQVEGFLSGERDYSKLEGDTGALVYPALHLYIYTAFRKLLPSVEDVRSAQYVFLGVYLVNLVLVATIYYKAKYPQVLLIPLTLSKRLHSIYLLRLFNDPLAMVIFYASIIAMMSGGNKGWRVGTVMYSLALGVKMNILLFLPGLLVLLFQYRGVRGTFEGVSIIGIIQLLLPAPFFLSATNFDLGRAYFTSAFDFSRQFLYKWTVNWRFITEDTFHSREFATALLGSQALLLVLFAATRWSPIPGGTWQIVKNGLKSPSRPAVNTALLPAYHIPLVLFTSNLIGLTFARSLHYQFHSWYFHQIPFLLFSGAAWGKLAFGIAVLAQLEVSWLTAPSTNFSSGALLILHLAMIAGLWFKAPQGVQAPASKTKVR